jgi:uncharacterized protein (TIGR00251 family)
MSDNPISAIDLQQHPRGVILPVRVHAGARQNAILGLRERALRVAVTAAPEKGKANRAVVALISKAIGVPKSSIEILFGETSPQKRLLILDSNLSELAPRLADLI